MDKKLSIIFAVTIGVFMLTVILFLVVVIDLNVTRATRATSTAINSSMAQHQMLLPAHSPKISLALY